LLNAQVQLTLLSTFSNERHSLHQTETLSDCGWYDNVPPVVYLYLYRFAHLNS